VAESAEQKGRLSNPVQRRLPAGEVDKLLAQHASGLTINEVAHIFNIHRTTVMSHLDDRNMARRPAVRKMTDERVAAAHRYGEGLSLAAVAAEFKIHARTLAREFQLGGLRVRPRRGWPKKD
jgi:AraC-like DNA-binding protein